MITGKIVRQRLNLCDSHVVADSIDYLEAKFDFRTDDWDGLDKWAHFAKDSAVYDIRLTDDCIRKEDHLNLSAGMWKVYLHGNEFRGGEVIQRITTDEVVLYVIPTGTLEGEPFPEIPASVTEQILARLENVEQNGGGGGTGAPGAPGFSPSASVEQTEDGAVITIKDKDGTTTATIVNGEDGVTPHIGENGNWWIGDVDAGIPAQGETGPKGETGQEGVGISYLQQVVTGLGDGSTNEILCILTNGKQTRFYIRNGSQGSPGYTPVKGTDYFTEAEIAAIVETVVNEINNTPGTGGGSSSGSGGGTGNTAYEIGYGLALDGNVLSAEVGADSFTEITNAKVQEIFNKAMEG